MHLTNPQTHKLTFMSLLTSWRFWHCVLKFRQCTVSKEHISMNNGDNFIRPKKIIRFSSTFWKKQMREAGFLFQFLFPKKQMQEAGLFFISSKTDEACIYMSCCTLWQCSNGRCTTCTTLMIFRPIQEPFWTLNQAIFVKNGPSQLHDGRHNYKERCDACIPALNNIKNQYQAPTRFSEDRVNVWGILNIWRTWTKRNKDFF